MSEPEKPENKKVYYPPKIVFTEKIEARAVTCMMADTNSCTAGPIQS